MKFKRLLSLMMLCIVGSYGAWAYDQNEDLTSKVSLSWTNAGNDNQGGKERYSAKDAYQPGKVLYATINGLESEGYYEVQVYAMASAATWEATFPVGNDIAQAYINEATYDINVIETKSRDLKTDENLMKASVYVNDGKVEFGIKNIKAGGNWYVVALQSIIYKGMEPSDSNPIDVTTSYLRNPSFENRSINGWTNSGSVALGALETSPANNPKVGNWFVEKWGASGSVDFNQTTTTLPAGRYRIGARVRNDADQTVYVYANDKQTAVAKSNTDQYNVDITLEQNNSVKLGVKCDNHPGNTWLAVDHFSILCLEKFSVVANPGEDLTSKIKNPGFESGDTEGWTVTASADTGAKPTDNATYKAQGTEDNFVFNHWSDGTALTQNIGVLPAGVYQLSAMLGTGDRPDLQGTVYLTVNGVKSNGMTARNGNNKVMHKETMTFVSDGVAETVIGAVGADLAGGGHWWYKADDFRLTYLNTADEIYSEYKKVYDACAPWTSEGEYYTTYTTYASYSNSTPAADLIAAMNFMNTKFDVYAFENASAEHPYLMENVIKDADLASNDAWSGSGRTIDNGQHWSGDASRVYFTQNYEGDPARKQAVNIPYTGKYELRTAVRVIQSGAYAEISIGDSKTRTTDITGATGGNINIDGSEGTDNMANNGNGFGWIYNKVEYINKADNTAATIAINLSNSGNKHAANAGGMYLYYLGDTFDYIADGTHYYYGKQQNINAELTDEVPVIDITNSITGSATVTATNPNGLVYAKNGQEVSGVTNNIVVDGTCANLILTDGHAFKAGKNFEATSAAYTMTAVADNKYGTLMVPFAVSTMPDGAKAYALDQPITIGDELRATETSIAANTPVLVTAAGDYTASNVPVAATKDSYTNGQLVGTYKAMTAEAGTYVLQKHDGRIAFYIVGDAKPTVNPFRAYIKSQTSGAAPRSISVRFDDADGISNVSVMPGAETIYDLSGRRISATQHGIYIINGKKIVK